MTIGVTSFLSPVSDHRLVGLVDRLDEEGIPAEFIDGPWEDRMAAVRSGQASVAWICGLLHSQLTSTGDWPLRVVAAPRSPDSGAPEYFGRIVVAEHSPVRHFGDLAGTRFAYNEESSLSGYRMMLDRLADTGADLGFFGGVVRSGSHVGSLRLVAEGTADCAIIDSIVLDDLDPPGFRIIESVGPYPAPPLTASQTASGLLSAAVDTHTWAFADESAYVSLRKRGPAGG